MHNKMKRFYEAAGCRTQTELAVFLGITQPSVSEAARRKTIPPEWLLQLVRKKRINPDWVLTGKGLRYLRDFDGEAETGPKFSLRLDLDCPAGRAAWPLPQTAALKAERRCRILCVYILQHSL